MRDNNTCGLSNTHHRLKIAGEFLNNWSQDKWNGE
jgi:hypothetical protein